MLGLKFAFQGRPIREREPVQAVVLIIDTLEPECAVADAVDIIACSRFRLGSLSREDFYLSQARWFALGFRVNIENKLPITDYSNNVIGI